MPLLDFFKKKPKEKKLAVPKDQTRKEIKKAVEKPKKGETRKTSEIKEGQKVKRKKATPFADSIPDEIFSTTSS